jgi:hypothetical protein
MTKYVERQTILKAQANLIQSYYDFIHTPPATLNKLLKKKHEERVLSVKKLMSSYNKNRRHTKKKLKNINNQE